VEASSFDRSVEIEGAAKPALAAEVVFRCCA